MPSLTVREQVLVVLVLAFAIHHSVLPKFKPEHFPYQIINDPELARDKSVISVLDLKHVQVLKQPIIHKDTWLTVAVLSAPKNFVKRSQVRKNVGAPLVFLIGEVMDANVQADIDHEHKRHGDILQLKTAEGYTTLSYKTLSGFSWIANATDGQGRFY